MKRSEILCEDISEYDLHAKYQYFNTLVFGGQLPDIRIVWATLKRVGGYAHATTQIDPLKPQPSPLQVRLGREDKQSNRFVVPGSLYIKISDLYKRSEQAIDRILLHEMIHIRLMVTGHIGEGHGSFFIAEQQRISKIVGFEVPRKDNLANAEFNSDIKIKPYGVILINDVTGFRYALYSASLVQTQIDSIRNRYESYAQSYRRHRGAQDPPGQAYATIYLIADAMWSEKAMRIPVQRKLGYGSYQMTDIRLLDDLRQNGTILAEI